MKDKKERVIDAVEATKVASLEGIVAGGGITLLEASEKIKESLRPENISEYEELEGAKIVMRALKTPIEKLLLNAGENLKILDAINPAKNIGYDVVNKKIGNMFEMGIIDPTRVIKEVVQNAISVAGMILITESVIGPEELIPTRNIEE